MLRRQFLKFAAAASAFSASNAIPAASSQSEAEPTWSRGVVKHILPLVNDTQFLFKISFDFPMLRSPVLLIGEEPHPGIKSDTAGEFWQFRINNLAPRTAYEVRLISSKEDDADLLCDPWELSTFPHPEETPDRARVLFYTCAGGDENSGFLPMVHRSRLLRRALSFRPDALIANGDHIYRDLRPQRRRSINWVDGAGPDRSLPVLGSDNEELIKRTGNPQIRDLYGTDFRSTPAFFIQDDHDFFDNDEATDKLITFPPDPFMSAMARATQKLYYPEFLPDPAMPPDFPASGRDHHGNRYFENFGTLRIGRLVEMLLYSVRKTMTLDGDDAVFVSPEVEQWLMNRMATNDAAHLINVPSGPVGWTAGKWGEWYPDRIEKVGLQTSAPPKKYWQPGWLRQHDRLLSAMSSMSNRIPMVVSGDLHATATARITRAGNADFSQNPIFAVLCGTIGTGPSGWPSRSRGTPPLAPLHLEMEEIISPVEHHGFTIADFTPDTIELKFFLWNVTRQSPEEIDQLQPSHIITFPRA